MPSDPDETADVRSFVMFEKSPEAPLESVCTLMEKLTSTELVVKSRRLREATSVATTLVIDSLLTPEMDEAMDILSCAV